MRTQSLALLVATAGLSSAHFTLNWPPSAGFNEDDEPTYPCGGFTPNVNGSSVPEINVDQFAVSIFSSHPAAEWAFLGTTNTAAPYNFTEIVPVINSTGVGSFCLIELKAPSDWAGKSGVIQVVDNSVDGVLYQCAAVKFVSGANTTAGPSCKNVSDFTATWTNLEGFAGAQTPTGSASISAASTVPTSTSSGVAAAATVAGTILGGLGLLAAGLVL